MLKNTSRRGHERPQNGSRRPFYTANGASGRQRAPRGPMIPPGSHTTHILHSQIQLGKATPPRQPPPRQHWGGIPVSLNVVGAVVVGAALARCADGSFSKLHAATSKRPVSAMRVSTSARVSVPNEWGWQGVGSDPLVRITLVHIRT